MRLIITDCREIWLQQSHICSDPWNSNWELQIKNTCLESGSQKNTCTNHDTCGTSPNTLGPVAKAVYSVHSLGAGPRPSPRCCPGRQCAGRAA